MEVSPFSLFSNREFIGRIKEKLIQFCWSWFAWFFICTICVFFGQWEARVACQKWAFWRILFNFEEYTIANLIGWSRGWFWEISGIAKIDSTGLNFPDSLWICELRFRKGSKNGNFQPKRSYQKWRIWGSNPGPSKTHRSKATKKNPAQRTELLTQLN